MLCVIPIVLCVPCSLQYGIILPRRVAWALNEFHGMLAFKKVGMNSLEHNLSWNVTWKMAQMKYNLVAQMKYCIFQKLAQMQYAQITNVV
jgi:hypothetical protein